MQDQLITTILGGGTAGVIAGLLVVIILLLRGDLVPKYIYRAAQDRLTRFEDLAYKAMALAERASKDGAG